MRIAICDDDPNQILLTSSFINDWSRDTEVPVEICEFKNAESFLNNWSTANTYDVAFLDIQMGLMSGIELAEKIRKVDDQLIIVFVTGFHEFVLRGYDVNALHFLIKPVKRVDCNNCLDQAYEITNKRRTDTFLVPVEGQIRRYYFDDLYYFEVFSHYITVHTRKGVFSYKKKISVLERELPSSVFVRCHRSCIINLRYVESIGKSFVTMDDGSRLTVSGDRRRVVQDAFIRYHVK